MKEVIMKKILFWIVLIVGTGALLGSCAKKDESTDAAAGNVAGTGTTASGSLGATGVSGTFYKSWYGGEPSGGCVDNSSAISAYSYPSDTKSFKQTWIVTGTSTVTESSVTYSDATCSTVTSYFNKMLKDYTVGSDLTGLTAGSSPAKPTTASKISSVPYKYALMANTTATIAFFLSNYETNVESGIELLVVEENPTTEYGLGTTATVSGSTYLYLDSNISSADNVTDWSSRASTYWQ